MNNFVIISTLRQENVLTKSLVGIKTRPFDYVAYAKRTYNPAHKANNLILNSLYEPSLPRGVMQVTFHRQPGKCPCQ